MDSPTSVYDSLTNLTGQTIFSFCYGGLVVTLLAYSLRGILLRNHPVSIVAPFSLPTFVTML